MPTNGKICYIEIPATDIQRSAEFYKKIFGWQIRQRGGGQTAFNDTTGEVSGTWVLGRPVATEPGLLIYIMVDSVAKAVDAVIANGGEIAQPIGADAPEITARFRDPAGNVIGLYQSNVLKGMSPTKLSRILAGVAAVILLATAAYHYTGYSGVSIAVLRPGTTEFIRKTLPGLWLFLAWHLIALAAAAGWAAFRSAPSARPLVVFCAAVVAVDTAFVFSQAGLFAGTLMLAGAAVCLLLAALRWPAS